MDINNSDFTLCLTVTKPVDRCHLENNACRFDTKRNVLVQSEAYDLKKCWYKNISSRKKIRISVFERAIHLVCKLLQIFESVTFLLSCLNLGEDCNHCLAILFTLLTYDRKLDRFRFVDFFGYGLCSTFS